MFAAYQDGGQTCIQVFFFRSGQNWGNRAYFPRADRSLGRRGGAGELHRPVLRRQAGAAAASCCRTTLPNRAAAGGGAVHQGRAQDARSACRSAAPRPASSSTPLQNAREALARRLAESSSQRTLLEGLHERFGLARTPRRIEVFDNSHIQGTNAVGAMIVAGRRGLREEPVPQVQHQVGGPRARRRLRHDARGADAALQAAGAGRGRGAGGGVRPCGSDPIARRFKSDGVRPGGSDTLPHRAAAAAADRPARRQCAGVRRAAGRRRTAEPTGEDVAETEQETLEANAEEPEAPRATSSPRGPTWC